MIIVDQRYMMVSLLLKIAISIATAAIRTCHPLNLLALQTTVVLLNLAMLLRMRPTNVRTLDHMKVAGLANVLFSTLVTAWVAVRFDTPPPCTVDERLPRPDPVESVVVASVLCIGGMIMAFVFAPIYVLVNKKLDANREQQRKTRVLQTHFEALDESGDRLLDEDEARQLFARMGKAVPPDFGDAFSQTDRDGSGKLSLQEFEAFYKSACTESVLGVSGVSYTEISQVEERLLAASEPVEKVSCCQRRQPDQDSAEAGDAIINPLNQPDSDEESPQTSEDQDPTRESAVAGTENPPKLVVDLSQFTGTDQAETATWRKLIESQAVVEVKGLDLFSEGAQVLLKVANSDSISAKVVVALKHCLHKISCGLAGRTPLKCARPMDVSFVVDTRREKVEPLLLPSLIELGRCKPATILSSSGFAHRLVEVNVSDYPLTEPEVIALSAVPERCAIEKLRLRNCGLEGELFTGLLKLLSHPRSGLTELMLSYNAIGKPHWSVKPGAETGVDIEKGVFVTVDERSLAAESAGTHTAGQVTVKSYFRNAELNLTVQWLDHGDTSHNIHRADVTSVVAERTDLTEPFSHLEQLGEAVSNSSIVRLDLTDCELTVRPHELNKIGFSVLVESISWETTALTELALGCNPIGCPSSVSVRPGTQTSVAVEVGVCAAVDGRWGEVTRVWSDGDVDLRWLDGGSDHIKTTSLTWVVPSRADLVDENYRHLEMLGVAISQSNIRHLSLTDCKFDAAGLTVFVDSVRWETAKLTELLIGSNKIGDEGMVDVLDRFKDISLTSLDISDNGCGASTAAKLAELMSGQTKLQGALTELTLSSCPFGYCSVNVSAKPGAQTGVAVETGVFATVDRRWGEVVAVSQRACDGVKEDATIGVAVAMGAFAAVDGRWGEVITTPEFISVNDAMRSTVKLRWLDNDSESKPTPVSKLTPVVASDDDLEFHAVDVNLRWLDDGSGQDGVRVDQLSLTVASRADLLEDCSHLEALGVAVSESNIRRLSLAGCGFDGAGLAAFADSVRWETVALTELDVRHNDLDESSLQKLRGAAAKATCQVLVDDEPSQIVVTE